MNRFSTLLCLALLIVSLARADTPRPNIIHVLIDDMGWGDFSCFGNTEAKTPAFDRMAAEGLRFSQFYVNSPICSPSRCAFTTGQYPQRWRISSYLDNRASNAKRGVANWLDPHAPTLARLLQQSGYATGHFGKWHLGGQRDVADAPPIRAYGFDASLTNFEGMGPKLLPLTLRPGEAKPGRIWEDAERLGGPVTWMQRSVITTGYADAARTFMDESAKNGKPFFINLWPDDVHSPYWPPVDTWTPGNKRGMYLAVLTALDRQLGTLFDHVRNTPALRDNTIILICSDNGPEPGGGSAGPFRGAKTTVWEGGTRSPLIVWAPGLMAKEAVGTRNETSVFAAFDLTPSLLTLAGVKAPADVAFDGENVLPVLLGQAKTSRQGAIYWRRPPERKNWLPYIAESQPDLSVREGDWKLLCDYDGSHPQLYNVAHDVAESDNLATAQSDVTARLTKAVLAWQQSMPPDNGPNMPAEKPQPNGKGKNKAKAKAKGGK